MEENCKFSCSTALKVHNLFQICRWIVLSREPRCLVCRVLFLFVDGSCWRLYFGIFCNGFYTSSSSHIKWFSFFFFFLDPEVWVQIIYWHFSGSIFSNCFWMSNIKVLTGDHGTSLYTIAVNATNECSSWYDPLCSRVWKLSEVTSGSMRCLHCCVSLGAAAK